MTATASPVKKARIPQATRTAVMRERLSKAAFNVIREVGYVNFRTSAVSKEAGVSQGAQLHHFPTKDSLAVAAMEYAYQQSNEAFEKNYAVKAEKNALVELILKDFRDFYLSDYFMVALDILMAGMKHDSLRTELTEMARKNRLRIERLWLERLVDDGWSLSDAEDFLSLSHSIVRGFAARSLVSTDMREFEHLLGRWQHIVVKAGLPLGSPN